MDQLALPINMQLHLKAYKTDSSGPSIEGIGFNITKARCIGGVPRPQKDVDFQYTFNVEEFQFEMLGHESEGNEYLRTAAFHRFLGNDSQESRYAELSTSLSGTNGQLNIFLRTAPSGATESIFLFKYINSKQQMMSFEFSIRLNSAESGAEINVYNVISEGAREKLARQKMKGTKYSEEHNNNKFTADYEPTETIPMSLLFQQTPKTRKEDKTRGRMGN